MPPAKPTKTLADYLVVGISPVLIMLLVGSLCFFLIEVFFRGEAVGSVRWVMFWFVMAVVLVSRIGIEQGVGTAAGYGLALAGATWVYLMTIHPAFILGLLLLGIVWWCAHKLTWDCTLIDEDEDASGSGLLETVGKQRHFRSGQKKASSIPGGRIERPSRPPHPPGLWVVYFSLAALPLFGVGQMLLTDVDATARRFGFFLLFVYVAAASGLLLTTSFLGLRRYLRQRYLEMPAMIAFGWIRFGAGLAVLVLVGALLLPRPGGSEAWQALRYQIDHKLRQASDYAARFSPHGKGDGRPGNEAGKSDPSKNPTASPQPQQSSERSPTSGKNGTAHGQDAQSQPSMARAGQFYHWFKIIFWLVLALMAATWFFRKRDLLLQVARSFIVALTQFFRNLFGPSSTRPNVIPAKAQQSGHRLFASYQNPFVTGKDTAWTHEELVRYSFEALQVWAGEQGIKRRPEQTAREFCDAVGDRFPKITAELRGLSFLYGHAAYGMAGPSRYDLEPVKSVWRFFYSG